MLPASWEAGDEWENVAELASLECDMYLQLYVPLLRGLLHRRRTTRVRGFGTECVTQSRLVDVVWAQDRTIQPWRAALRESKRTIRSMADADTSWHGVQQSMHIVTYGDRQFIHATLRRPRLIVCQKGSSISAKIDADDLSAMMATPQASLLDSQLVWRDCLHAITTAADLYEPSLEAGRALVSPADEPQI